MVQRLYMLRVRGLMRSQLWAQILVAMALAIATGLLLSPDLGSPLALDLEIAPVVGEWLRLPGQIFLNLIQMVVIGLVATSIVLGITSSGDADILARVAGRIAPYFLTTTTIAVLIGYAIATIVQPGSFIELSDVATQAAGATDAIDLDATPAPSLAGSIADIIPASLTEATLSANMFQIVVASLIGGTALASLGLARVAPLIQIIQLVQDASLTIVGWAMRLAPVAVFGLIADFVMRIGISALLGMSVYILCVIGGLAVLLCVYFLIVAVLGRRSIFAFESEVASAQLLAFSTSSSAATMPLSLKTAEHGLKVRPAVARFVIPLGATVNMDGTALYQVIAALFIAQIYQIELSAPGFVMLVVTVVGASIGSPSTPGVGIIILASILHSLGIPASGVAILLGVDRILDMCRTSINVTGDLVACVVMDRWLAGALEDEEEKARAAAAEKTAG
ncbi:MAG: dicarboxylate/amino acid:cation symporter [Pseudomonadota bacterium]|nr:dicarboxylate/amino acid:cation symporter [Pseudomonadota bacterium]